MHSAAKPSEQAGFVSFANVKNVGFATPETAFQSFNFAMRHQGQEPIDDTARTMELWMVPDNGLSLVLTVASILVKEWAAKSAIEW